MMSKLREPPTFNPDEGDCYSNWKNDIEVWKLLNDEKYKKQYGAAIYLSLKGTARDAVRSLDATKLAADDGVEQITAILDSVYLKDTATQAYCAFRDFVQYKRGSGESFATFIVEFEKRYRLVEHHKMVLPTGAKAYFLLEAANLTIDNERLARATAKLDYDDMKTQIQKVFGDNTGDASDALPVKSEEVLYTRNRGRGGYRGRGGFNRNYSKNKDDLSSSAGASSSSGTRKRYDSNPIVDGVRMKCHICESIKHFAAKCPHKKSEDVNSSTHETMQEEANMSINITLFAGKGDLAQCFMMAESAGHAVLDTACTKTVAGVDWFNEYVSNLSDDDKLSVEKSERKSHSSFRFGDGVETMSLKTVDIPMYVPNGKLSIKVEIVKNKLPLLLSKPQMSELGFVIDTGKHEAKINGVSEPMKLSTTKSGHWKMPIAQVLAAVEQKCVSIDSEKLLGYSKKEKQQKALKLHRQMSHGSAERLKRLLKSSGCNDSEFLRAIEECVDKCEFCRKYKKPFLKPVVGFPLAQDFNQVVCMDLKEIEKGKLWFLHMIDAATRYTVATIVQSKRKEVIVEKIFSSWIAYFGAPKKLHSDCGGEFTNDLLIEMNEKLGIETSTTPGESPFSNGLVERSNKILYESMMKTMDDAKCDMQTALAWSVSAKNCLQNVNGYSPNQLVFGINANIPSILTDAPPALEKSHTDLIRSKLTAIHSARQNFVKAESSERIRRALRHQVRTFAEERYEQGDKVYFKRKDYRGWKGPAIVLGSERNFVLIREGSRYFRCHPCQLMHVNPKVKGVSDSTEKHSSAKESQTRKEPSRASEYLFKEMSTDDDSDDETEDGTVGDQPLDDASSAHGSEISNDNESETSANDTLQNHDQDVQAHVESANESLPNEDAVIDEADQMNTSSNIIDEVQTEELRNNDTRPTAEMKFEYKLSDGTQEVANVLKKQPRSTSKFVDWLNIRNEGAEKDSSLNWEHVVWWRPVASESVLANTLVDYLENDPKITRAKESEVQNLKDHDVYEVVEDSGQEVISAKWVLTEKINENGESVIKGRLVARGFEETIEGRTDSPTCNKQSLRLVFATAASHNWEIKSIDIKAAFLQGNILERDVYILPPEDLREDGKVWKLKRCIYGLCDAPRSWYKRLESELTGKLQGIRSKYDKALFYWLDKEGHFRGVMALHVDDFVLAGTNEWLTNVVGAVMKAFEISSSAQGSFCHLGLQVVQTAKEVLVDQNDYLQDLEPIQLSRQRQLQKDEKLDKSEIKELRALAGKLIWLSTNTRPDIAFEVCQVSNYGKTPTVSDIVLANKIVEKANKNRLRIVFPDLGNPQLWEVKAYSDASHANLKGEKSTGGFIVFVEGNGKLAPILWSSKKLARVVKSPLAAEAMEFANAADAAHLVASSVQEMFGLNDKPVVTCVTDSKSLKDHAETTNTIQDKRLRVDMARIQEMVELGEIKIQWVNGKQQLADSLTKYGASTLQLLQVLGSGQMQ